MHKHTHIHSRAASLSLLMGAAAFAQTLPTAGYVEVRDVYTQRDGLGSLLALAGFDASAIDLAGGVPDVDVLVIGSFATESPEYRAWAAREAGAIRNAAFCGTVVVELTQADQTAQLPAFIPAGLSAMRTDTDTGPVVLTQPSHPLVRALPWQASGATLALPTHIGRTGSWETWNRPSGFDVVAGVGSTPGSWPVVLEADYGRGRFVLMSLYFDKLEDTLGAPSAPGQFRAASAAFALSLRRYAEIVAASPAQLNALPLPPDLAAPAAVLNVFDIFEYFRLFAASDARADIDRNGSINVFDVFAFFDEFARFGSCP